MGIIRGGLLVFSVALLFISLLLAGMLLTVSSSLEYDNIQQSMSSSLKSLIAENADINQLFEDKLELVKVYCKTNNEYTFKYEAYTFLVPCSAVNQGFDSLVNYGVDFIINNTYYKNYECEFFDCFEKTGSPEFLISEKAQNYFKNKFYLVSLISLALLILMFFLSKKKSNFPIIAGVTFTLSALALFKFPDLISTAVGIISPQLSAFSGAFMIFFSKINPVATKMIIIGSVLVIAGIIFKILKVSFKISSIIEKIKEKRKATAEKKPVKSVKDKPKKKQQKK